MIKNQVISSSIQLASRSPFYLLPSVGMIGIRVVPIMIMISNSGIISVQIQRDIHILQRRVVTSVLALASLTKSISQLVFNLVSAAAMSVLREHVNLWPISAARLIVIMCGPRAALWEDIQLCLIPELHGFTNIHGKLLVALAK